MAGGELEPTELGSMLGPPMAWSKADCKSRRCNWPIDRATGTAKIRSFVM